MSEDAAKRRKSTYTIWISLLTIVGIILFISGMFFLILGLKASEYSKSIKDSYSKEEIKYGKYIELDVVRDDLLGEYKNNAYGYRIFDPIIDDNEYKHVNQYVLATRRDKKYYAPLKVNFDYIWQFDDLIAGRVDSVHIIGKFVFNNSEFYYPRAMEILGVSGASGVDRVIDNKYCVKVINMEEENQDYYKGLALLILSIICLSRCIDKTNAKHIFSKELGKETSTEQDIVKE